MNKVTARVLSPLVASLAVLVLTATAAQAESGPTAYHGSDWARGGFDDAVYPDTYWGISVKDMENDGNDVFVQVWYYDSGSGNHKMTTVYDRTYDLYPAAKGLPSRPKRYRVCEENGSCGDYVKW
ncbi:hypothetical protein ABZ897_31910 [Nonomuraea sp. NPDC046802]|uniref:hypothetical protein n=1 Tax=Nonomuraea sp. NPDC046802 TaxID=3154919 RepID=UPI0033CD0A6B